MKRIFPVLVAACLLSSCATIFNSRYYTQKVISDEPAVVIWDSDTLRFDGVQRMQTVQVERSRRDKELTVIRDTSVNTYTLHRRTSGIGYLNLLSFGYGFIVDALNPKIWQYENPTYLSNIADKSDRYLSKIQRQNDRVNNHFSRKGQVNLRLSLPAVNQFSSAYEGYGRKSKFGLNGVSIGLDVFYAEKMFLNISGAGIIDLFLPFPLPFRVGDRFASVYGVVSNNHMLAKKRLSVGYGLSFGHDWWNKVYYRDDEKNPVSEPQTTAPNIDRIVRHTSRNLGFAASFYYYSTRGFYMGLLYRPMFLQFADKARFKYQHTISLDLGWRIRLAGSK